MPLSTVAEGYIRDFRQEMRTWVYTWGLANQSRLLQTLSGAKLRLRRRATNLIGSISTLSQNQSKIQHPLGLIGAL